MTKRDPCIQRARTIGDSSQRALLLSVMGRRFAMLQLGRQLVYRYVHALRKHGKYYELFMYRGEEHGLKDIEHQLDAYRQVTRFMNRFLKGD